MRAKILLLSLCVILTLALLSVNRLMIWALSRAYNVDISFKNLNNRLFKELVFDDLTVTSKAKDLGFFSKKAVLKPRPARDGISLEFDFKDMHFLKSRPVETPIGAMDTLWLISFPFQGPLKYNEISGKSIPYKNGIYLKDLKAAGDDIALSFTGYVTSDSHIDGSLSIHFSKNTVAKIPDILSSSVLDDEANGWKSLTVKLSGSFTAPNIQISSKRFRLNIKPAQN